MVKIIIILLSTWRVPYIFKKILHNLAFEFDNVILILIF